MKATLLSGFTAAAVLALAASGAEPGPARQPAEDVSALRERALHVLIQALRGPAIQGLHAAEALCWNGEGTEVKPIYLAAQSSQNLQTRIASWRVLAQLPGASASWKQTYRIRVRDAALATSGPQAEFALESLAKLGYAGRDKPFVEAAAHGSPVMQILARWILANSARPADERYLAQLLDLPEERMRAVTAYALRALHHLLPETIAHIERRLQAEPATAPDRFFYVITLYIHGPRSKRALRKTEMYRYARTADLEGRYQCLLMMGRWGDLKDLKRLAPYLTAKDADVRIGAANSILQIVRRKDVAVNRP